MHFCERFEPRSHFKSRLSLIVRVNVVLNRTVVVDSDFLTKVATPEIYLTDLTDSSVCMGPKTSFIMVAY